MKNANLHNAKAAKNDEFYTQISDIEKELVHYREHFKDKIIFCNCDDPEKSNFWKYFRLNFDILGLKKLITTHYEKDKPSYKLEMIGADEYIKTPLSQNGDFRSPECLALLDECDICITNPPFSLFREFLQVLIEHKKEFLIIGNKNALTYKEVFPLIRDNKIWLGYNAVKTFKKPDGGEQTFGNIGWYTNLEIDKRYEDLILYENYTPEKYPKYDNYDAINVDKVDKIPCDYYGVMGVPITFLDKYNPEQFEIIGQMANTNITDTNFGYPFIAGKRKYARILIKRKENSDED